MWTHAEKLKRIETLMASPDVIELDALAADEPLRLDAPGRTDETPCSACADARKEAAQNWRFFELAATEKNRLLVEADEWKAIAIELSYYVKPGWDDSDATLKKFSELRDHHRLPNEKGMARGAPESPLK